ncbi:MAG: hypothetical protein ACI4TL_00930 [Candidatus Cryptobacteroides sp.]
MQKQNYLKPSTDIVEMFGESALLTGSPVLGAAGSKNEFFTIVVGEDDSEFE